MRLIYAEAAKNALYNAVDDISRGYYAVYGIEEDSIEEIIDSVPPAQPEQKEGRWITDGNGNAYCSECGLHTTEDVLRSIALVGEDKPKFCSNCGAKMTK